MLSRKSTWFYASLIAVASLAIGMVLASRLELSPQSTAQTLDPPPMNSEPIDGQLTATTFREIARAQSPTVVSIRTESRREGAEMTDFFGDDFFRRFFGQPDGEMPQDEVVPGAGTGFIIDRAGVILTNNHVVENATKIEVGFFGDETGDLFDARVVGRDPLTDSALIELVETPPHELPVARFGDSDQMAPGDWVVAIGNPFNLNHTVTVGVVSALERPFQVSTGRSVYMLQTDAAINPGNSGGPLMNLRGEVVGINTAILSNRAANLGIGFAVPINLVRELLPQLREGKVTRGRMGVTIAEVRQSAVAQLGLDERTGALVSSVEADGPAAGGGVRPGDVVVEFDGEPVENSRDLVDRVVRTAPGSSVPVVVMRNRERLELDVTIEELNLEEEGAGRRRAEAEAGAGFGLSLQDLTPDLARRLRVPGDVTGALVADVAPRSAAEIAGVQRGDIVLTVNGVDVNGSAAASRELQAVEPGGAALLLVLRQGQEIFIQMERE